MSCRCAPALDALKAEVDRRWPGRDKLSDGCCGDADHAARKSDHNPDASGYAHARDIDEDLVKGMGDSQLWAVGIHLLDDPRTKYLIYEARILYPDGTDRPYHGINAHRHHLHISIKANATHDTRPWLANLTEEDDMPTIAEIVDALKPVIRAEVNAGVAEVLGSEGVSEGVAACRAQLDGNDAPVPYNVRKGAIASGVPADKLKRTEG